LKQQNTRDLDPAIRYKWTDVANQRDMVKWEINQLFWQIPKKPYNLIIT